MKNNVDTWHIRPFINWWGTEQEKFHCGQFNEREIAYSAWLAGIDYYTKKIREKLDKKQTMKLPEINSKWIHHNGFGIEYTVILIANTGNDNPRYPITVVYQGDNGNMWAKPLKNFLTTLAQI
jgi:hypothetical protein